MTGGGSASVSVFSEDGWCLGYLAVRASAHLCALGMKCFLHQELWVHVSKFIVSLVNEAGGIILESFINEAMGIYSERMEKFRC